MSVRSSRLRNFFLLNLAIASGHAHSVTQREPSVGWAKAYRVEPLDMDRETLICSTLARNFW